MGAARKVDCLIVGGGLAGTVLALELDRHAYSFCLLDPQQVGRTASRVAAGILNPVTGKRLVRSWRADELLEAAHRWYPEVEAVIGRKCFEPIAIQRLYRDADEQQRWARRTRQPEYQPFLGPASEAGQLHAALRDDHGSFAIEKAAVLDTEAFLDAAGAYLNARGSRLKGEVDYAEIQLAGGLARWRAVEAKAVVFCEGWRVRDNPWFGWIALEPARGEVLEVRTGIELPRRVYNREKWVLPVEDGGLRIGSTWAWENLEAPPSPQGRTALLQGLRSMLELPEETPDIVRHRVGVRPASQDRLPVAGRHPAYPQLAVLNGLGSKGTLYAPFLSGMLRRHLFEGAPLLPEIDVARFAGQGSGQP